MNNLFYLNNDRSLTTLNLVIVYTQKFGKEWHIYLVDEI